MFRDIFSQIEFCYCASNSTNAECYVILTKISMQLLITVSQFHSFPSENTIRSISQTLVAVLSLHFLVTVLVWFAQNSTSDKFLQNSSNIVHFIIGTFPATTYTPPLSSHNLEITCKTSENPPGCATTHSLHERVNLKCIVIHCFL